MKTHTIRGLATASDVCDVLAISPRTLTRLRTEDPTFLPPVMLNKRTLRWKPADLERRIARRQVRDHGSPARRTTTTRRSTRG